MLKFFPQIDTTTLPKRVRVAIREQEEMAERLISWFQLFVVLTLGTLYMVGPKPNIMFDIIPWALLAYLVLTLGRIV